MVEYPSAMQPFPRLDSTLPGPSGAPIRLRRAAVTDMRRIRALYAEVYGANYPLSMILDPAQMRRAIESPSCYWLLAEFQGRIVASLVFELDHAQRIAKAFGAVVVKAHRKHDLANTMMAAVMRELTGARPRADAVYATTRTVTTAPQHMTENLGFAKLGIFPNAHKVFEHETHCLAAYFTPAALRRRRTPVVLIPELEPFHRLVRGQLDLGRPILRKTAVRPAAGPARELLSFESISAPHFVRHRFARQRNRGVFATTFVPFHEPNLLLVTPDQKTEVYLHHGRPDRSSLILGGHTNETDSALVFDSIATALNALGVSYIELLVDAYSPEIQAQALSARFLPSAYFPAFRRVGGRRWDYIVFSRSFEILDFRNVRLISIYRDFLKEYFKAWQTLYINQAFQAPL